MIIVLIVIIFVISYAIPKENENYINLFYFKNIKEKNISDKSIVDTLGMQADSEEPITDTLDSYSTKDISIDTTECNDLLDKDIRTVLEDEDITPSAFAKSIYDEL